MKKRFLIFILLFISLMSFSAENLVIISRNGKFGFGDLNGNVVVNPIFDQVYAFQDNLARVRINEKWGLINTEKKFIVYPLFEELMPFSNNYARFKRDEHWGFINKAGKVVIPPIFTEVEDFNSDGMALVTIRESRGYINTNNKITWILQ